MQLALENKLNDELTKERGGRHGGKGHEFQRYWALCHLLKVDLERDDYLVLFEFIEDVAVLNNESKPEKIEFFQLKKKDGNSIWTKTALAKPPKGKLSILAKLFESRNISPDASATISFVSNSPVALSLKSKLDSKNLPSFEAIDVDASILDQLQKDIATELKVDADKIQWDKLSFVKSPLSLNDLETHAQGHVVSYLSSKYPDHNARADVFFRLLYGEIKIRATSTEDAATFEELKKLRGISKSQISSMLTQVIARKPVMDVILDALEDAVSEGVPYVEREAIKAAGKRFTVDRISQSNLQLITLEQAVAEQKTKLPSDLITKWQVVVWIYKQLTEQHDWNSYAALEKPYILALIIYGVSE
jgi:hypothetical protein